jgi:glyoxylase-like metal-dependent hydrolase (beta-lactamase superfamily II)
LYELIKVGEKTYYLDSPTKIGIYMIDDKNVYLIDSGNDKDAGRKIMKILDENKWNLLGIINTHSNADHIGGNRYLQQKTGCLIISTEIENAFAKYPILESSFLYGGYPCSKLKNKFLLATSCQPTITVDKFLPDGLEYIELPGHYFGMIGIKTSDNIYFLADSIFSENIINKYHVFFIYDVKEFLATLDKIDQLDGKIYIPSHAEATNNVSTLTKINRDKIFEVINSIVKICAEKKCFEEILKEIFDLYNLNMDFNQYVLVGSTVRSYLSYLHDENKIECIFEYNRLLWKTI